MIKRIDNIDDYFLNVALAISQRGTCQRRQVGCVLVNQHRRIMSTGYNGVASGQTHCLDQPCAGVEFASGTGLDECAAIHAEQNAIADCADVRKIETCYVTVSPCVSCVKLLLGTSCQRIVFSEVYPQSRAQELWKDREWVHQKVMISQSTFSMAHGLTASTLGGW